MFVPSYGCHQAAPFVPQTKPESWRCLHVGCLSCGGPKVLAFANCDPKIITFWVCVKCTDIGLRMPVSMGARY